ncbi:hypothetical protein JCM19037_1258 [Geomicrobium sp. JCM 19037]|uniref:hypothetical protein n=1 Tax=Geomicrobium sp. JCM 19037 TaxID=1460634 RepID=UPI00045F3137|nr:hypothetical protein [Geomicrobium sp. JCM 19037]GAK02983.1 hypothetical protein JCM19037_1258 [Geomicrobium sp. JCM 19037]
MSEENKHDHPKKKDNFVKNTSREVTDAFGNTVDSAGRIVKSVSGEGGLVGKATDTSGRILKGTAGKANQMIGKSSEAPGNLYRKARGTRKKNEDDKE